MLLVCWRRGCATLQSKLTYATRTTDNKNPQLDLLMWGSLRLAPINKLRPKCSGKTQWLLPFAHVRKNAWTVLAGRRPPKNKCEPNRRTLRSRKQYFQLKGALSLERRLKYVRSWVPSIWVPGLLIGPPVSGFSSLWVSGYWVPRPRMPGSYSRRVILGGFDGFTHCGQFSLVNVCVACCNKCWGLS